MNKYMNKYRVLLAEDVKNIKSNSEGNRIASDGTPLFNDGDHHVLDLTEANNETVVILLPNGNAVTIALMSGGSICDISARTGTKWAESKVYGIDDVKKTEVLESFKIYSLAINSKIKLHEFEPTDTEGHAMACKNCFRTIGLHNADDWDLAHREECKGHV